MRYDTFLSTALCCFILFITRNLSYKRNPRKNKEEIKKVLIKLMVERVVLENGELTQGAENVVKLSNAVSYVKEDDKLLRSEKQNVINLIYREGYVLHKFKESKNFVNMVKELGISKSTITK